MIRRCSIAPRLVQRVRRRCTAPSLVSTLRKNERLVAIMGSTGLMMTGHGCITPILPLFATSLGASAAELGLALSAFAVSRLVLNVPLGFAADAYGRKPLIVGGPLVSAIGMMGTAFSGSIPELLAWRAVAGAGNAAYLGGSQVYLQDISTKETRGRVLGANHAALLMGVSFGPVLGGLTSSVGGLTAPFAVVSVFAVSSSIYSVMRLTETKPSDQSQKKGKQKSTQSEGISELLIDPRFLTAGFANSLSFSMRQGGRYTLYTLIAVHTFEYSAVDLGMLFGAMAMVDLACIGPSAWLSDKLNDRRHMIVPGMFLSAAAVAAISLVDDHTSFLAWSFVWALGSASQGHAMAAYAADVTPSHIRGLGTSLFRSAGDIGFVAAPIGLGILADATTVEFAMQTLAGVCASSGAAVMMVPGPANPTMKSFSR